MADAVSSSDAEKAESYIGSLVRIFTKSEIRYEGFVFYLDCNDRTIGIRNVKSYGTEGRRKDGPQVPATEKLYEYMYFRGSDIKDLLVLSSPSAQTTSALPDDPAIIKNHHLPAATLSLVTPSTFQAKNTDSNAQSAVQAPPFPGNLLIPQSVGVSVSQVSTVPAPLSVNVSWPSSTNYWYPFTGIPEGTSCSQQQVFTLPPHPQGLMLANTTQQTMQHIGMNTSLAGSSSNITEAPRLLLPTAYTGSPPFIATLPPPSSQGSNGSLAQMFSNLTINSMENKASGTLPTAMVNSSSEAVTSSGTNPVVPLVVQTGQSVLRPPYPIIPRAVATTVGISSAFDWKPSMTSHPSMQPGLMESSSSHHLEDGNNDETIIIASISENTKEMSPELPKALDTEMHGPASSSRYINRRHIQDRGDGIHRSNRGRSQGRGDQGNLKIGAPHHRRHITNRGRGYAPIPAWYSRHHGGGQAYGGGSESSLPVARFTEDFDFEKMNQRFNKEEIWGLLGKSKSAEGDDDDSNATDAQDEAGDVLPKVEQPIYSKGDFFDSISCRSLDAQSDGSWKLKISEQRRIDVETFSEILKPERGRGVMRPHRGGRSGGPYRGRGFGTAGSGHPINYWNPVAKN